MKKLLVTLLFCLFFIPNVNAESISLNNVCTSFFYANDHNSTNSATAYKCGSDNKINLFGSNKLPDTNYSEYLTGFDSKISNLSLLKNTEYTIVFSIKLTDVETGDISLGRLERFNKSEGYLTGSSNITLIDSYYDNYKPFESSEGGSGNAYFDVKVIFVPKSNVSTIYVGFNARSSLQPFAFYTHYNDINFIIDKVTILDDSNSTIINQNQTIIDQNNQTNEKLDDLNQNITNNNVNGVENAFESFEGFITDNSTITQLITMPITLYSSILNGIQSTCQPFILGDLFGTSLTIPCVNIGNYLGSTLWSMIDVIISGFAIFAISKKLIKIFNNFSSMKEGDVIND